MTRNSADMHKRLYELYVLWVKKMKDVNLNYILTCVARDYKEQLALYAKGREDLDTVNNLMRIAKLPFIMANENIKVTWTLKSLHIINLDDQEESNDKSRAFDFAIVRDKKPIWDIKVDTNKSSHPDYDEAGYLWESVGGVWGGRFKNPDPPHCQI